MAVLSSNKADPKKPLAETTAMEIHRIIQDRGLEKGDRIPNEFELAKLLEVSRSTVREAVKILISRNIVEIRRGKGTFVSDHPGLIEDPLGFRFYPDQKKLVFDLLEIRSQLEPWIAETAAMQRNQEQLEELKKACTKVEEDIISGKDHLEHDMEFHATIARCTGNQVMTELLPVISCSVGLFGKLTRNSLAAETIVDHRNLLDAIIKKDPVKARSEMITHLAKNREALSQIFKSEIRPTEPSQENSEFLFRTALDSDHKQ